MVCNNQYVCGNYPSMCKACEVTSSVFENYPYFAKITKVNVKFKIFFGHSCDNHASDRLNQWLAENPNVRVVDYQYQQARMGDHSICILYEEVL